VTTKGGASDLASARFTKKDLASYDASQWVAFEKSSDGKLKSPRLFEAAATRDRVRSAYSNYTGADFSSTRAIRVKTYKNRMRRSN
jgi:hypothetical protein